MSTAQRGPCEAGAIEKSSLTAFAREQVKVARRACCGRSADTAYGGHEHVLRQTVTSGFDAIVLKSDVQQRPHFGTSESRESRTSVAVLHVAGPVV